MSKIDLLNEIRSAKAEMESWPEWKKASTQLEGTDIYFEKERRASENENNHQLEVL